MAWRIFLLTMLMSSWVLKPLVAGYEQGLAAYNLSNFELAKMEFLVASGLGDTHAMYMLGLIHNPSFIGYNRDPAEAMKWYRMAAEQGHPLAQYKLGMLHRNGFDVVTRVRSNAFGVEARATPSQRLGIAYVEALKWLTLAAKQGLPDAQYNLGLMYASGAGIPADFVSAYLWWAVAVEYGSQEAREKLFFLEQLMSKADVGRARTLAGEWTERH